MRLNLTTVVVMAGLCLLFAGVAQTAVTTASHTSYALRPCSTCKEAPYPSEAECKVAAEAEAQRAGETRTTGSAVYTCVTRLNVIATFRPNPVTPPPVRTAALSWTQPTQNTDGSKLNNLAGYRIAYGTSSGALTQSVQIANPGSTRYTIENLSPGTYYFAVRAYTSGGTESGNSNIVSKVVL